MKPMNKIKINYQDRIFMYAYLRYIDLSLDRSRWDLWREAECFFDNNLQPQTLANYLIQKYELSDANIELKNFVFFSIKKSWFKRYIDLYFSYNEMAYLLKLLEIFEMYLSSNFKEYNLKLEKLRIDICEYYYFILEPKISRRYLKKLMKVEHFNQNDAIETIKLQFFIPDDF